MLPQAKKLFRFRFPAGTIVIVLAILLFSLGHERVVEESCSEAVSAWLKVGGDLQKLLQRNQDQFLVYLLDCSEEIHKQIPEAPKSDNCETFKSIILSTVLAPMIDAEISKIIDESTSLATKERLALLSVYLVFLCHETSYCSCRAANLSSVIKHPEHGQKLQRLLSDLELILDVLNLKLMPKWKSDNTTILKNNADTLINRLNQFSTRLQELSEDAYRHVNDKNSESIWRRFFSVPLLDVAIDVVVLVVVLFCVFKAHRLPFIIIFFLGGAGAVYLAFRYKLVYQPDKFSSETVAQLSQLKADTDALHDKIVKLKTAIMRTDF